eukprot:6469087-Amphidinium_carterae.6
MEHIKLMVQHFTKPGKVTGKERPKARGKDQCRCTIAVQEQDGSITETHPKTSADTNHELLPEECASCIQAGYRGETDLEDPETLKESVLAWAEEHA